MSRKRWRGGLAPGLLQDSIISTRSGGHSAGGNQTSRPAGENAPAPPAGVSIETDTWDELARIERSDRAVAKHRARFVGFVR
jgi:hypothetical protein